MTDEELQATREWLDWMNRGGHGSPGLTKRVTGLLAEVERLRAELREEVSARVCADVDHQDGLAERDGKIERLEAEVAFWQRAHAEVDAQRVKAEGRARDSSDSLERLQRAAQSMVFSRRRFLFSELQRRVSGGNNLRDGTVMAWPDVLLFLTPEIIDAAIETTKYATHEDVRSRLDTRK